MARKREGTHRQRLVDHTDTKRGRRVVGKFGMVATHQRQPECRVRQRSSAPRASAAGEHVERRKSPRNTMRAAPVSATSRELN